MISATDTLRADDVDRPVTILVGHSGSGKSEVAINLALASRRAGSRTVLVDLDLIKPYFRSRLVRDLLAADGVELIVPGGDHLYADSPIVVPEVRRHLAAGGRDAPDADGGRVIVDVGGNDNGARVLGSLSRIVDQARTEVLFVANANRPFTGDIDAMSEMIDGISKAAGLEVSGLVSNTHLMDETTTETVRFGLDLTRTLSRRTGVPVRFCCIPELLSSSLYNSEVAPLDCPVLVLKRHILPPHSRPPDHGRAGVL